LRPSDENGSGGTLSGNKLEVYVLLKICKLLFGVSITSFLLKFAIDRALDGKKYETADIGSSLERVLRFYTIRGKLIGVHPALVAVGVKKIEMDFQKEELKFIFV